MWLTSLVHQEMFSEVINRSMKGNGISRADVWDRIQSSKRAYKMHLMFCLCVFFLCKSHITGYAILYQGAQHFHSLAVLPCVSWSTPRASISASVREQHWTCSSPSSHTLSQILCDHTPFCQCETWCWLSVIAEWDWGVYIERGLLSISKWSLFHCGAHSDTFVMGFQVKAQLPEPSSV